MQHELSASRYEEHVGYAIEAVREAGQYLVSLSEGQRSVHARPPHDVKVAGDITSESIIVNAIRRHWRWSILSEESGEDGEPSPEGERWIVDPIDGSFNFYKGIPLAAISVALWKEDEPILGVIYDFPRHDLYAGLVGVGAWRDNERIHVSDVRRREEAVLATGLPVTAAGDPDYIAWLSRTFAAFGKIRMFGSASLSLAYLAAGSVDAYGEDDIFLWDVAAGIALTRAGGGHAHFEPTGSRYGLKVRCASHPALWE